MRRERKGPLQSNGSKPPTRTHAKGIAHMQAKASESTEAESGSGTPGPHSQQHPTLPSNNTGLVVLNHFTSS